jgi:hypothetical protein
MEQIQELLIATNVFKQMEKCVQVKIYKVCQKLPDQAIMVMEYAVNLIIIKVFVRHQV